MKATIILFGLLLIISSFDATAALDSKDVLDTILDQYKNVANTWAATITTHASKLFWELVAISMIWTFGFMALRKADIGEFFAEFIRFTVFTGFFWWLLINGPAFADTIIDSMRKMGAEAAGLNNTFTPSDVVDVGFMIFDKVVSASSIMSPVNSAIGIIIALIILVIIALIAINMLLLLISGWILAYAGIFFLGFGGSRWTSEMAITYYKTVLGIAMQLFAMLLIVGIGKTFLFNYYNNIGEAFILKEYAVMLIVSVVLLVLSNKVPPMISGIITGSSIGNIGIGNFGAGAVAGAAAMAGAAVSMAGSMIGSSASNAAGGASALMEAIKSAQKLESAGVGGSVGTPRGADGSGTSHGAGFSLASSVISELGKGAVGAAATQIKESSRDTLGGKIATAIEANSKSTKTMGAKSDDKPAFDGNSLGGEDNTNPTFKSGDEVVDAFVNKDSSNDSRYYSSVDESKFKNL